METNKIVTKLMPAIPSDWTKVVLYTEIADKYYSMFFYSYVNGEIQPVYCYDLCKNYNVAADDINNIFEELYKIMKSSWDEANEKKQPFYHYTLVVNKDLTFREFYDYTKLEDCSLNYVSEWKKKYLTN